MACVGGSQGKCSRMKKIRRGSYTPEENAENRRIERMMQMGAELGNGGRVLNFFGGVLAETRKQTTLLEDVHQEMKRLNEVMRPGTVLMVE